MDLPIMESANGISSIVAEGKPALIKKTLEIWVVRRLKL
jgi:hypothetical protein